MFIVKRDSSVVEFESERIENAVFKAVGSESLAKEITSKVIERIDASEIHIEDVQDLVETVLREYDEKAATEYSAHRERRKKLRENPISSIYNVSSLYFNEDPLREFVYFRTYSRWIESKGRREVWLETVDRYMNFMKERMGERLRIEEYNDIHNAILSQRVMPSMRLLQFAGDCARRDNVCIYNCAYISPVYTRDLVQIMYISMCGTGVGWSVEGVNVNRFPAISPQTGEVISHVIGDSKEGWCDAFQLLLDSLFNGSDVEFDFSHIRPKGARLRVMGGRAAGPDALGSLFDFTRKLILGNQGKRLSTLNVYDLICKIGEIVVSGGVRRTANISLSDLSDVEIRDAKKGEFWKENTQRFMANNSTVYNEKPSREEFDEEWTALIESGSGERGIFNRGDLKDIIPERRKHDVFGCNPCGEILLRSKQFCNLSEVICRPEDNFESLKEKIRIATILGTYQATFVDFKYIDKEWRENQEEEALLGVSLTGQWDCPAVRNEKVLRELREYSIEVNKEYSRRLSINQSTAITAVKPSGSVSQVVDSSSGLHARWSKYYIRRVRISATDPLFQMMKDQGVTYHPENGQNMEDATTFVIEFPVKAPGNVFASDLTALEQLEYWKMLKVNYTEHNPSATIYVGPDEWKEAGDWVWDNWKFITGLSFLPRSDHVYPLAPYETITEERYNEMKESFPSIDFSRLPFYEKNDNTDVVKEYACVGDKCEVI